MESTPLDTVLHRLDEIQNTLNLLVQQRTVKEFYTTDEVAKLLGKRPFTVREWCRFGRIRCRKQNNGRGKYQSWVIAHEELLRIQREGLLPPEKTSSSI